MVQCNDFSFDKKEPPNVTNIMHIINMIVVLKYFPMERLTLEQM